MSQDKVWAAISGSREPDPSFTGSGPSGFDPGRVEATTWALNAVNSMVSHGVIKNTVEARSKHLDALLNVLLPASVDGRPKDGDAQQAPLATSAVGEAETPNLSPLTPHTGDKHV